MREDFKQNIAEHASLIAILSGTIVFLVSYYVSVSLAGWVWLSGLILAVILFILVALGVWLVANNIVDVYTLEAMEDAQNVYHLLNKIREAERSIRDKSLTTTLDSICKHSEDLILYTKQKQPNNLLSCCSVLEKWLDMIVNTTLSQILDIQAHPEYRKDPVASMAKAELGFNGFDTFLVNSIQTIAAGSNMEFENEAKMLDASRYNVV